MAEENSSDLVRVLTVARSLELPEKLASSMMPYLRGHPEEGILDRLCLLAADEIRGIGEAFANAVCFKLEEKIEQAKRNKLRAAETTEQLAGSKFVAPFEGKFAAVDAFHSGLDARIGYPSPTPWDAMRAEHCERPDSQREYVTTNYGKAATYSLQEWQFVVDPQEGKTYPNEWSATNHHGRRRVPIESFLQHRKAVEAGLSKCEVVALRLYTGPGFVKYNSILRGFPKQEVENTLGNMYTTTIHCIVSGIIKLSKFFKLPPGRKVFRGSAGMVLPEQFSREDEFGCRGGVECGMLSTTSDISVALSYMDMDRGFPLLFQIELGQIDRGAEISWVSQYPGEAEILMPPLSNLEAVGDSWLELTPAGHLVEVWPIRINVNIKSLTVDELEQRRKALHVAMLLELQRDAEFKLRQGLDLTDALAVSDVEFALAIMQGEVRRVEVEDARALNDDTLYRTCLNRALECKHVSEETTAREEGACVDAVKQRRAEDMTIGLLSSLISGNARIPWDLLETGTLRHIPAEVATVLEARLVFECLLCVSLRGVSHIRMRRPDLHFESVDALRVRSKLDELAALPADTAAVRVACLEDWQRGPDFARLCAAVLGRLPRLARVLFDTAPGAPPISPLELLGVEEAAELSVALDSDWKAVLLAEALAANTRLRRLSLSGCSLSAMGSSILGLVIASALPSLRVLDGLGPGILPPWQEEAGEDELDLSEEGYQRVAELRDSLRMGKYIRKVAVSLGLEVVDEGGLSGFADWYSGVQAVQSLERLKEELPNKVQEGWILPLTGKALEASFSLTEEGYAAIAGLRDSVRMGKYIRKVAVSLGLEVVDEGGLSGFADWYSGVQAVQSLERLKEELPNKVQEGWILPSDKSKGPESEEEKAAVEWSVDVDTFGESGALALAFVGRRVREIAGRETVSLALKGCSGNSLGLLTGQGAHVLEGLVGLAVERSGHGVLEGLEGLQLACLPSLRLLDLSGCTGCHALLAAALPSLLRLEKLRVGHCAMGAGGCEKVLQALPSTVAMLDMRDNGIADEGALSLASLLPRHPSLRHLNISRNSVGDPGAAALADALARTGSLLTLVMNYNGLGSQVREALTAAAAATGCAVHL